MLIQPIIDQLNIDRNIFESIWQQLGLTEEEANRRVNIIDHNIESMTKLNQVIGDTDLLGSVIRSDP